MFGNLPREELLAAKPVNEIGPAPVKFKVPVLPVGAALLALDEILRLVVMSIEPCRLKGKVLFQLRLAVVTPETVTLRVPLLVD